MKTFNEFLTEASEYDFIKKAGFKSKGTMSDGSRVHSHPTIGEIHINKHGEWHHIPHGSSAEDGFEGTTGNSLKAHLDRLGK